MVLVQQLSLIVLAGELEHGDSVHAVGHFDGGGLGEGSRYATETGTEREARRMIRLEERVKAWMRLEFIYE